MLWNVVNWFFLQRSKARRIAETLVRHSVRHWRFQRLEVPFKKLSAHSWDNACAYIDHFQTIFSHRYIQCTIDEFISVSIHCIVLYARVASLACFLFPFIHDSICCTCYNSFMFELCVMSIDVIWGVSKFGPPNSRFLIHKNSINVRCPLLFRWLYGSKLTFFLSENRGRSLFHFEITSVRRLCFGRGVMWVFLEEYLCSHLGKNDTHRIKELAPK